MSALLLPVATLVGLMLVAGGVAKRRDPARALAAVAGYRLLPAPLVGPVARALPPAEMVIGAAMLLLPANAAARAAGAAMLLAFAAAVLLALAAGRRGID